MSFTIQKITPHYTQLQPIQDLYEQAFPADERAPFEHLLERTDQDTVQFLAFYQQQELIGFTYVITASSLTYIFYLAVVKKYRHQGYGGEILTYIQDLFPDHCLFLDIEVVDREAENYQQRKKRKAFYLKHHFQSSDYVYHFYHVDYEILTFGKPFIAKAGQQLFYDFSCGHVDIQFQKKSETL